MTQKIRFEKDFNRPWGGFVKFIDNKPCTVKILQIKKGESLSLINTAEKILVND